MKQIKLLLKILKAIITLLLCAIIASNLYVLIAKKLTGKLQPTVFGFSTAVVISGSMSGEIEVNDIIVAKSCKIYSVGDVISFESGSAIVTHRIAEKKNNGYITKGDANNTVDQNIVRENEIVGKVILVIPKIGVLIMFLQTPLGMTLLLATVLFTEILDFLKRKKTTEEGNVCDELQEKQ